MSGEREIFELSEKDQRNNIWRLAITQALAGANAIVVYAPGAYEKFLYR